MHILGSLGNALKEDENEKEWNNYLFSFYGYYFMTKFGLEFWSMKLYYF